jgi:hypothetical protein
VRVPAPEGFAPLRGLRVVADPGALDGTRWTGTDVVVLRTAPDEAFALGATAVERDDEHAIVEDEAGFVAGWFGFDVVARHVDWALPVDRPGFAQGALAGVPAKVWVPGDPGDGRILVVVAAAYADELAGRLR